MNLEKTIKSLEQKLYTVKCFDTHEEAAEYLDSQIDGKVVGFGDSRTIIDMKLYDKLSKHNTVYDPNQSVDNDGFLEIAKKCLTTEVYLTSVNAMAETGEMVNIDGTGNRVAGSLFGHEKVYFVVSTNKIVPDLEDAVFRARNVAAPKNSLKYDLPTPCVVNYKRTGELKCFNCRRPERICNGIITYLRKMNDIDDVEVVLINEEMGFQLLVSAEALAIPHLPSHRRRISTRFDGRDINSLDLPTLRKKIGTVMQEAGLFQGSIYSNIVITAPELTLEDAWEAAEKASIANDIRRMPMGMHTIISEGQGGVFAELVERQRLDTKDK